ncbi:hypothetical protein Sjap_019111 [Stephania japonica]|uniref:Uncharacterized protein n=1 Tax=Stephania japonica TaxID=461633 RepID=A0AAP0F0Z1_9MAGN
MGGIERWGFGWFEFGGVWVWEGVERQRSHAWRGGADEEVMVISCGRDLKRHKMPILFFLIV